MKQLIDVLHSEGLTLVVKSGDGKIYRFTQRGVKDLLMLVSSCHDVLSGALVADKAVGKAAAACMIVGGIHAVHADVMSAPAFSMLTASGITAEYDQLVDHIVNRAGNGWCPMELISRDVDNPMVILQKIKDFLESH